MKEIQEAIEKLIDRYAPRMNTQSSGAGTITSDPDPEFNEDILHLLSLVAEKQRDKDFHRIRIVLNLNERQLNQLDVMRNTPLITEQLKTKQIKCVECGAYFDKKKIIIKGDIDTCDDCLCPE